MDEPTASNDLQCFDEIGTMLATINQVACDELRRQGHTLECAQMLCIVAQETGQLFHWAVDCQETMIKRVMPKLHLADDDEPGAG